MLIKGLCDLYDELEKDGQLVKAMVGAKDAESFENEIEALK